MQYGSGVIISETGLMSTALHVIELDLKKKWKESYVNAVTVDDNGVNLRKLKYKLVRFCKKSDIAILQLPKKYSYHSAALDLENLTSGVEVYTIGNQGFKRTATEGLTICPSDNNSNISSFNEYTFSRRSRKTFSSQQVALKVIGGNIKSGNIVTTNPVAKGDSGSGLYKKGRLVGIITSYKIRNNIFDESFMDVTNIDLSKFNMPNRVAIAQPISTVMSLAGL